MALPPDSHLELSLHPAASTVWEPREQRTAAQESHQGGFGPSNIEFSSSGVLANERSSQDVGMGSVSVPLVEQRRGPAAGSSPNGAAPPGKGIFQMLGRGRANYALLPVNELDESASPQAGGAAHGDESEAEDPFILRGQHAKARKKKGRLQASAELKFILKKKSAMRYRGSSASGADLASGKQRGQRHDSISLVKLYKDLSQSNVHKDADDDTVVYLPPWTLDPDNMVYVAFQAILVALSVVVGFVVPFNIAFLDATPSFTLANALIYATDLLFMADVATSFFVPQLWAGEWRTVHWEIAAAYMGSGMFWYDALASTPWDVVLLLVYRPPTKSGVLGATTLGFLRLLRLRKLADFLWEASTDFGYNYFYISLQKLAYLTLYVLHWAACVFFFLARIEDFGPRTWVGRCDPPLAHAPPNEQYVTSIYWATTTVSTTGYGDLAAYTVSERIWAIFIMLVNLALTAYVFGNMTVLLTKADAQLAEYRDKLMSLSGYMSAHQVPAPLQQQVQSHLKLQFETAALREDVLKLCPANVRTRVARHVYSGLLNKPYLFHGTSDLFRDQLTTHCREDFFLPNVDILHAGDSIADMYIIASGTMQAFVKDYEGRQVGWVEYEDGDVVGEFAFLCEQTQLWNVKTLTTCRVLCVSREDYQKLSRANPADHHQVVSNLLKQTQKLVDGAGSHLGAEDASEHELVTDIAQLLQSEVDTFQSLMTQETVMKLCYAAKRSDTLELFRLSSGGFDVNHADYDGRTPLHLAACAGQDKAVQYIIGKGGDVNAKDAFHRTPLAEAVSAGHWSTARLLRSKGGELHLRNEATHLCRLANQGNAEQIKRLLEFGANPNAADYDGRTPLHVAAADGHLAVAKVLVEAGADKGVKDRWKRTPMDEAKSEGTNKILEYLMNSGPG